MFGQADENSKSGRQESRPPVEQQGKDCDQASQPTYRWKWSVRSSYWELTFGSEHVYALVVVKDQATAKAAALGLLLLSVAQR